MRPHPCHNKKSQTNTAKANKEKSTGVTVTGVRPCKASVLVKNKFQPLQTLMIDDHIDDSSEQLLQGQRVIGAALKKLLMSKMYSQKLHPCLHLKKINQWWEKNKTGFLARGSSEGCQLESHSMNTNVCQATPAGEFSMHKNIDKQMLSRNSKPHFQTLLLSLVLAMKMMK